MPYIPKHVRKALDTRMRPPEAPGELNYMITTLLRGYVETKGLTYGVINDILGAVEGAKAEFYRRVAAPYEDQKIRQNGDCYGPEAGR